MSKPISERRMKNAIKKLGRTELEFFTLCVAYSLYGVTNEETEEVTYVQDKEWTQDTIEDVQFYFDDILRVNPKRFK
jgi:hypothetical protein